MMLPKVKHLPITENRYLGTERFPRSLVLFRAILSVTTYFWAVADTVGCAQKRKKIAHCLPLSTFARIPIPAMPGVGVGAFTMTTPPSQRGAAAKT